MKKTSKDILSTKNKRKLTHITALDYFTARAAEEAEIDIIGLGGTAAEMFFKGSENGTASTMEELLFCLNAVRRGAPCTFIMASLSYGLSFISDEDTLRNAVAVIKAAKSAGMNFIAITNTYAPEFLKQADLIIDSYSRENIKIVEENFL